MSNRDLRNLAIILILVSAAIYTANYLIFDRAEDMQYVKVVQLVVPRIKKFAADPFLLQVLFCFQKKYLSASDILERGRIYKKRYPELI